MKKISNFLLLALCASLQLSAVNKFLFAVGTRTFTIQSEADKFAIKNGLKPRKAVKKIGLKERSTLKKLISKKGRGKQKHGKIGRKNSVEAI